MAEDPQRLWFNNVVAAAEAMTKALQVHSLATDKDIATKAAYRAMGMDPRSAPTFGLGLMTAAEPAPPAASAVINSPAPSPASSGSSSFWPIVAAGLAFLSGGSVGVAGLLALRPAVQATAPSAPPAAVTAPAKSIEFDLVPSIAGGALQWNLKPVEPAK